MSYSQNTSESDVFKKIIDYEIGKGVRGMYVQCEKPKIFFEAESFKEETGLNVPENVLKEIKVNELKSKIGIWNSELINELNFGEDFIKIIITKIVSFLYPILSLLEVLMERNIF